MWQSPKNQFLPWMQALSHRLSALRLPLLVGPNLWISTDYVFSNKQSSFDVIGVLLATPESSFGWESHRNKVRDTILGPKRRMGFKSLGDRIRRRAYLPFLRAADCIDGVVFTVGLDPSISKHFVFGPSELELAHSRPWLVRSWKYTQLGRMATIAHFLAFFVAGLSTPRQNLFWISDEDDIFANQDFARDTGTLFTKFLNAYSTHTYGNIAIGTTAITEQDLLEEDLASVADIAAGGSAELLTTLKRSFGYIPGIAADIPDSISSRTQEFADWFFDCSTSLQKVGCVFEQMESDLRVSTWNGNIGCSA